MGPGLRAELQAFRSFCTVRFFGAQTPPILPVTAEKYCDHLRCAGRCVWRSFTSRITLWQRPSGNT